MKRKLIIFAVTVIILLISGTAIQQTSSVDAISGATKRSKPKVVTVSNTLHSKTESEQPEQNLNISDTVFPSDLDPAHEANGCFTLAYGVGETLVFLDNEMVIQPWLAQSWENVDSLTWEIKIKPGIKYHNGADVTGQSVKESLERAVRLNDKAVKLLPLSSMQADDLTLTIRTSEPCPELIHNLADTVFIIVDAASEKEKNFSYFPVCTGPFIPAKFTGNTEVILHRFDEYRSGVPALDGATIQYAVDTDKLMKALEKGVTDAAVDIPLESLQGFEEKDYRIKQTDTASAYLVMMNTDNTILSDMNVRQAIALATDQQAVSGAFATLLPFSDNAELYPYDPGAAKKILAGVGYTDTDGDGIADKNGEKLSFRLAVTAGETELLEWAKSMKVQLGQAGIEISIKTYNEIFFTSRARYGRFDIMLMTVQTAENGDAQRFFADYFASDGSLNYGHYRSEQADMGIRSLESEFDPNQRILITDQIQALTLEDAAFVFLGYPQTNLVLAGNISELSVHPVYRYRLTAGTTVKR